MNNSGLPANVNRNLRSLIREGLTVEQACASLGLDVEAGQLAMLSLESPRKEVSVSELIENFRPEAVGILMDIARCSERDADRVKACQILLEGKGVMPEVNAAAATALFEKFEQMKRILSPKAPVVIDVRGPQSEAGGLHCSELSPQDSYKDSSYKDSYQRGEDVTDVAMVAI